ncbi:hypothetical protein [Halovivax sp.]|uniref:hypothetical protein n=1 Tax=Halovivax sp. TaxID=1935978 RepID=UPI0025C5988D|nr:hypothetical protein [Halovivax sp.]
MTLRSFPARGSYVETSAEDDMIAGFLRTYGDRDETVELRVGPRELERTWAAVAALAGDRSTSHEIAVEAGHLEVDLARSLGHVDSSPLEFEPADLVLMAFAHLVAAGTEGGSLQHRRQFARYLRTLREYAPESRTETDAGP